MISTRLMKGYSCCPSGDEWYTEWYHEGTYGEYHTVVFEETSSGNQPVKMYCYVEDIPYENGEGGGVLEVYHRNGRWTENRLFSEKLNIKAAGYDRRRSR